MVITENKTSFFFYWWQISWNICKIKPHGNRNCLGVFLNIQLLNLLSLLYLELNFITIYLETRTNQFSSIHTCGPTILLWTLLPIPVFGISLWFIWRSGQTSSPAYLPMAFQSSSWHSLIPVFVMVVSLETKDKPVLRCTYLLPCNAPLDIFIPVFEFQMLLLPLCTLNKTLVKVG